MYKISVIIPVYNAKNHIKTCFDSLFKQSDTNFQIICVNDGSTDNSLNILNEYAKNDCRIKVVSQKNEGPGSARNEGLKYARGEYILFLDIDDYLELDCIEKLYNIANKKDLDILFYNFIYENKAGTVQKLYDFTPYKDESKKQLIKYMVMGKLPYGQFHLIKTRIIKDNDCRFSTSRRNNEELPFKLKALSCSYNIGFTKYAPYHYIKQKKSASRVFDLNRRKPIDLLIAEIYPILEKELNSKEEIDILLNTMKTSSLLTFCYKYCANTKTSFIKKYKFISTTIKEQLIETEIIKKVDNKLFSYKVKFLYSLIKCKLYSLFIILSRVYYVYDKIRISKT